MILCNHYGDNSRPKLCKTEVCKDLGIKIFLDGHFVSKCPRVASLEASDDRPENIKCDSIKTVVYDQSWNKDFSSPRVNNWKEVEMFLLNEYLATRVGVMIGISGKIGSGKSCVVDMIKEWLPCFQSTEFARRVKDTVSSMTATPKELCYSPREK